MGRPLVVPPPGGRGKQGLLARIVRGESLPDRLRAALVGLVFASAWIPVGLLAQPDEEAALRQRVTAYWDARVQERYVVEYTLLEPAFREQISLPRFVLERRHLHFLEYTLEEVEISGASAVVAVRTSYEADLPKPPPGMRVAEPRVRPRESGRLLREQWVKGGGSWYKRIPDTD